MSIALFHVPSLSYSIPTGPIPLPWTSQTPSYLGVWASGFPVTRVCFPRLLWLSDMSLNIPFSERLSVLFFLDSSLLIPNALGDLCHCNLHYFVYLFVFSVHSSHLFSFFLSLSLSVSIIAFYLYSPDCKLHKGRDHLFPCSPMLSLCLTQCLLCSLKLNNICGIKTEPPLQWAIICVEALDWACLGHELFP